MDDAQLVGTRYVVSEKFMRRHRAYVALLTAAAPIVSKIADYDYLDVDVRTANRDAAEAWRRQWRGEDLSEKEPTTIAPGQEELVVNRRALYGYLMHELAYVAPELRAATVNAAIERLSAVQQQQDGNDGA